MVVTKKPALKDKLHGTYLITHHDSLDDARLVRDVTDALTGGARILQYRDKTRDPDKHLRQCKKLRGLTADYGCVFIVNDDVALARASRADGVHLGREDNRIKHARDMLGPEAIIGSSCYNQFELAVQACDAGADYVAFGRFLPASTKPDAVQADLQLLQQASKQLDVPVVAIGGITQDNASGLIDAGADMIAIINAVFGQQNIQTAAGQFQNLFIKQG